MKNNVLNNLIQNRFRSDRELHRILYGKKNNNSMIVNDTCSTSSGGRSRNHQQIKFVKGTYRGVYFRVKVPPRKILPDVPKLSHLQAVILSKKPSWHSLRGWWTENWAVLLLNFGSICSLVGFTRSDVLELRCLSVTGSLSAMVYNLAQRPRRLTPILWSLTFASVNGFKISEIVNERSASVQMTGDEEDMYVTHFLPHGVTPKQFEAILNQAETIKLEKGSILIKQGEKFEHVFLIVKGETQASALGRYLTAASSRPVDAQSRVGGASGAWVGEMAFLESFWLKEQGKVLNNKGSEEMVAKNESEKSVPTTMPVDPTPPPTSSDHETDWMLLSESGAQGNPRRMTITKESDKKMVHAPKIKSDRAMYTIIAKQDCTVLRWSHADMELIMRRSNDMRAAMTRAMAAAIVGKVINFTVSRSRQGPSWTSWLVDWKNNGEATIAVETNSAHDDDDDKDMRVPSETFPSVPIKKFA